MRADATWHWLGPLRAGPSLAAVRAQHPVERAARRGSKVALDRPVRDGRNERRWLAAKIATDAIDLRATSADRQGIEQDAATCFFHAQLDAGNSGDAIYLVQHDGAMRLWCNGERVYESTTPCADDSPPVAIALRLEKGENHLLVKCTQQQGPWRIRCAEAPRVDQAKINDAIDGGVAYLQSKQYLDGSWGYRRHHNEEPGHTAFTLYTLLRCGLPKDDPTIQRGMAFLAQHRSDVNYALCAHILALAELGKQRRPEIEELVQAVLELIAPQGLVRYSIDGMNHHMAPDLSNSIFTALALRAAADIGVKVPRDIWPQLAEGALYALAPLEAGLRTGKAKPPPRGFGYTPGAPPYGSMTVAGLGVLSIAKQQTGKRMPRELRQEIERGYAGGMAWLDAHMAIESNPQRDRSAPQHLYYWLWGIERLGSLDEQPVLGRRDWYADGARYLVGAQKATGEWAASPSVRTHLALLFLKRATTTGPITGRQPRSEGAPFQTTDKSANLFLHAAGGKAATIWLDHISKDAFEQLGIGEANARVPNAQQATLRLRRAQWFCEGPGFDPEVPFATRELDPSKPTAIADITARIAPNRNGAWRVRLHLDGLGANGEEFPIKSPELTVVVDEWFAADSLEYAGDRSRYLIAAHNPEGKASSVTGEHTPDRCFDGQPQRGWLCSRTDKTPWIDVNLGQKCTATEIVLTPSEPRRDGHTAARPATGEIVIGDQILPFRIDADPMRKTVVALPKKTRLSRFQVRIRDVQNGEIGNAIVGFSMIEAR
ncbi:MAG: hypothetical protein AB8H80_14515 [Planctomycetota bacterium]